MQTGEFASPWGRLVLTWDTEGLRAVQFDGPAAPALGEPWRSALAGYVAGQPIPAELPVNLTGLPPFTRCVLETCRCIPFGETRTYAELAREIGHPRAARAVGQALARNPLLLVIPCHRVIGTNGRLTGFLGGLDRKAALLGHERTNSQDIQDK